MKIDIKTLAVILCLSSFLHVIGLSVLYRINMVRRGLGCWLTGNALWALGFVFNFVRDVPGVGPFAIVANNALFMSGLAFIHIGVQRFFDRDEHHAWLVAFCTFATVTAFYFTFIDNDLAARRVNFSFGSGILLLAIARALSVNRTHPLASSTFALRAVFLVGGIFFVLRGLTPFIGADVGSIFSATLTQTATYVVALVISTLWTLGFIILINQRLAFETRQANELAEDARRAEHMMLLEQRQFLSMMSHEFRTSLAVADFAAANLTEVPPLDQDDIDRRAQMIRRATGSMSQLIENCMSNERIELGGFKLMRQETDINQLISEATHLVNVSPYHHLQIECDEATPIWSLDPTLMRIALSNLVDNAVKYSTGGTITVRKRRSGDALSITVANQGSGISADESEKLFHKFVRGSAANRGKGIRGTGLGLFISQHIARAHGGDVRLLSGEKEATVFEIRIPE